MTDQRFITRTREIRAMAAEAVLNLPDSPHEVVIRPFEKTRTLPQNSRHWATLTEYLKQIDVTIQNISTETGYTVLEVKRLIAKDMPPEHIAILFARKPEVAHEVLKAICGIHTSTRLGTKEFSVEFEERMEAVIAEIVGHVNSFADQANAA